MHASTTHGTSAFTIRQQRDTLFGRPRCFAGDAGEEEEGGGGVKDGKGGRQGYDNRRSTDQLVRPSATSCLRVETSRCLVLLFDTEHAGCSTRSRGAYSETCCTTVVVRCTLPGRGYLSHTAQYLTQRDVLAGPYLLCGIS